MKRNACMLAALSMIFTCASAFAADATPQTDYSVEQPQDTVETHDLQNKQQDRLEIFAIFGNRYDWKSDDGITDESSVITLKTTFRFNDYFTGVTQSESHQWWGNDVDTSIYPSSMAENYDENWKDWFYQGYVEGKYNIVSGKIGRFTYIPAYGIVHGDYEQVSGGLVSINYNDRFSITAVDGTNCHHMGPFQEQESTDYYAGDFTVNILPILNIKGAYMSSDDDGDKTNYIESGFDIKLPLKFSFETAYIDSDADDEDTGYYAKLQYNQAIPFVRNTYDIFFIYHDLEANSIMGNDIPLSSDIKGLRFGFHYVPINNIQLWCFYDDADVISTDTEENYFRVQIDFFFDWKAL